MTEFRDPTLCRLFVTRAKTAFAHQSGIADSWSIDADEDHAMLRIQGEGTPGFDISVEVWPSEILLQAEGWHHHYDTTEPITDFAADIVGLLLDMMSPSMRIREELRRDIPYRWHLENLENGHWVTESTTSLVFRPWFGRKTERIFSNHILPTRPPAGAGSIS